MQSEIKKGFTCIDCEDSFDISDITNEVDGLCQKCLDENYINCNDCNEFIHNDNSFITKNEDYICEDCNNDHYFTCDDCGEIEHANNGCSNQNVIVCEYCRDDNYSYCEHCDEMTQNENMSGGYCESCNENNEDGCDCDDCNSHDIIHHYGYKPELNFHKISEEKENSLYLGVELEIESRKGNTNEQANTLINLDGNENEELFFLAFDGTIDKGFEIITHPATVKYHLTCFPWQTICKTMVSMGARSHNTNTCGFHLHVNKNYFTQSELVKLGLFVHSLEKPLSFLSRRKRFNWGNFKDIKKDKKIIHKNDNRYEAINFQNFNTIEFRLYKGTLNFNTVLGTIDLTDAICHFIKHIGPAKIVNKKEETWQDFINFAKNNKHKYFIKYMELRQETHSDNLSKEYHI